MRPALLIAALVALVGCRSDAPAPTPGAAPDGASRPPAALRAVVEAARVFDATLSDAQRDSVRYDLALDAAAVWSNFPYPVVVRNGLLFRDLSEAQQEAALALARAALSEAGFATFQGVRAADDYLGANPDSGPRQGRPDTSGGPPPEGPPSGARGGGPPGGGITFDSGVYSVAFLGEPSETEPWMLQLGGHHYALNLTVGGDETGTTPFFVGVEPLAFEWGGQTYAPMAARADAVTAMLDALTPSQLAEAEIEGTFRDILVGPGADFEFPEAQEGLEVASLSEDRRALVADAIRAWVMDAQPDVAARLLEAYTAADALDQTTVGYATAPDLSTVGGYVRIDGPRVWIEIAAQSSDYGAVHYHSVWRDKALDYGGLFSRPD